MQGILYLLLSIFLSVIAVAFFKAFQQKQIHTLQAIVFNYITCILIGSFLGSEPILAKPFWNEPWIGYAIAIGVLFISIFYAIGLTSQKLGISVSMIAAKLSVVIPVSMAIIIHAETIKTLQIIGIGMSLVAVNSVSRKEKEEGRTNQLELLLLPAIVFVGSGLIDAGLNFMQHTFIPPAKTEDMLTMIFLVALIIGTCVLLFQGKKVEMKSVFWGLSLGIPNYFCMFFLVRSLSFFQASFLFPINNIGIVVVSTITSLLFFKEKMSLLNWIGFGLAIVSIALIAFA